MLRFPKVLEVMGESKAGKKTIIGCLMYKVVQVLVSLAVTYELTVCGQCCFDLAQLGCWERDGLHHYEEISLFYERNGGSCCFFAPNGPMTVKSTDRTVCPLAFSFVYFPARFADTVCSDSHAAKQASNAGSNASAPDYVLWVVDVTSADKGKASYDLLMSGLSDCSIRYTTCLIIVINKMYETLFFGIRST